MDLEINGNDSYSTESPEENTTTVGQSSVSAGQSSSRAFPFELTAVIVCIGFVGMIANGAVLWALVSNHRKGNTNVTLILNQTVADFCSCTFLLITNVLRSFDIYLSGVLGNVLCMLIFIDTLIWVGLVASITSLVILTLERYFKIVHPVLHRKQFRPWIFKAAVLVTWGNGILRNILHLLSTRVVNGRCVDGGLLKSFASQLAYSTFVFVWDFAIPLIVFFYCYGRILVVVRSTRGEVSHPSNALSNTAAKDTAARIQLNVIRTLLMISATFVVCWSPCAINRMLYYTRAIPFSNSYSITVAVAFLTTAVNPLIYAAKYQPVRRSLLGLIGIKSQGQSVAPMTTVTDNA